jgi:hypothetical protein
MAGGEESPGALSSSVGNRTSPVRRRRLECGYMMHGICAGRLLEGTRDKPRGARATSAGAGQERLERKRRNGEGEVVSLGKATQIVGKTRIGTCFFP